MVTLDEIIQFKKKEVEERKSLITYKYLEKSVYFETQPLSLKKYIERKDKSGIIAEIKRKSPSKGALNPFISIEQVSIGYMQAGASALSVVTDAKFFGGSTEDLTIARKFNFCPILRKEFIIDEFQILESKSIGADAILLIATCLSSAQLRNFIGVARSLGLEVLIEIHSEEEFLKVVELDFELMGVNNRNLATMEVNLSTSENLCQKIPDRFVKISESGIKTIEDLLRLKKCGFNGFLIGEQFMAQPRPEEACRDFIEKLRTKELTMTSNE